MGWAKWAKKIKTLLYSLQVKNKLALDQLLENDESYKRYGNLFF